MQYKILNTSKLYEATGHKRQLQPWVQIQIDFQDGALVYVKRMAADITSLATIDASIQAWWTTFKALRQAEIAARPAPAITTARDSAIQAAITNSTLVTVP
jgi:hypothetical protein